MRRALVTAGIVGVLTALLLWMAPAGAVNAPRWYCSTTTTQGQPCIPDPTTTVKSTTTTAVSTTIATTTTAATTTVPRTTTTTPSVTNPCPGSGCPQTTPPTTPTTAPATTSPPTTAATTTSPTTIPDTTAVDQTLPPSATTSVGEELPHTGSETPRDLAVAFGLLLLGWATFAVLAATRKR